MVDYILYYFGSTKESWFDSRKAYLGEIVCLSLILFVSLHLLLIFIAWVIVPFCGGPFASVGRLLVLSFFIRGLWIFITLVSIVILCADSSVEFKWSRVKDDKS
jgi:hypothetical protein